MAEQNSITDAIHDIFLAGVGAVTIGAEKSKEIVDQLVQKGQITVDQGKELLGDLKDTTNEKTAQMRDQIIAAHMKSMTPEEREAFVARVTALAAEADNAADKVVVEAEADTALDDAND